MEQSNNKSFKYFWHKAISIVGVAVFLFHSTTICAQIKIVGDDYSGQLTASKSYYDKDVDFEKFFPSFNDTVFDALYSHWSSIQLYGFGSGGYDRVNLTGDTVYLPIDSWIESIPSATIINLRDKEGRKSTDRKEIIDFCIDRMGAVQNRMMKKGYYEIVGYVFCSDNAVIVRRLNRLGQIEEVDDFKGKINGRRYLEWDKETTTKKLKDRILEGVTDDYYNCPYCDIKKYIKYIVFRSLEDDALYYLSYSARIGGGSSFDYRKGSIIHSMMPLRFYNIAKTYIGEDVYILYAKELVRDPLSDRLVKIMDSVFVVKDIVMKNQNYYVILNGLNTGSFALPFDKIYNINKFEEFKELIFTQYKERKEKGGYVKCLNYRDGYDYYTLVKRKEFQMLKKREMISQSQLEKELKLKEQQRKQAQAKADAAFRQQMLTKYGDRFGNLVANKQVSLDMTKEMCRDAWGKPINTYRTTTKYGQSEVWSYNYKTRVYFYNGKVVQIDD